MKHTAQDNAANKVIMVCVTGQRSCDQLIARGLERAGQGSSVHVVHCVETGRNFLNTPFESDAIEYLFTAAQIAGAELSLIRSEAGRPSGKEPLVMRLQRRLPEVEFDVVAARG